MSRTRTRPWLGGVCARLADSLDWSVAGIRVAAVVLLWLAPLLTGVVYLLASWWLRHDRHRDTSPATDHPTMAQWDRRMAAIDRELERCRRV